MTVSHGNKHTINFTPSLAPCWQVLIHGMVRPISEGNYLDQNASLCAFIRPMLPQAMLKCTNGVVHLQAALTPLTQCHMHLQTFLCFIPPPLLSCKTSTTNKSFFSPCKSLCGKNTAGIWSALICYQVKTPQNTTCIQNQKRNLSSMTKHRHWIFRLIHILHFSHSYSRFKQQAN